MRLRIPPGFDGLDAPARRLAGERFLRGAFQIGLTVEPQEAARGLSIDPVALASAVRIAREVAAETGPGARPGGWPSGAEGRDRGR